MAVMLDYRVTVCEPREEYHEGWQAMEGVTLSRLMPDDLAANTAYTGIEYDSITGAILELLGVPLEDEIEHNL